MPWNSTFPLGSVSVKANKAIGQQNTTYIEVTMGNSVVGTNTNTTRDHFWNVGGNEDGRHRFINSPAFTVASVPADPVVGSGMNAVFYLKTTNTKPQWFTKTDVASGSIIYQVTPTQLTGTVNILSDSTYSTLVAVPANCYGYIFIYTTAQGQFSCQTGFFRSGAALVEAWSNEFRAQSEGDSSCSVKFGNGSDAVGLNIRARRASAAGTSWNYIVKYRAL